MLTLNVHILAEGVARFLYNISEEAVGQGERLMTFPEGHSEYLVSWLDYLSSYARSPQLLHDNHPMLSGLQGVSVCMAYMYIHIRVVYRLAFYLCALLLHIINILYTY